MPPAAPVIRAVLFMICSSRKWVIAAVLSCQDTEAKGILKIHATSREHGMKKESRKRLLRLIKQTKLNQLCNQSSLHCRILLNRKIETYANVSFSSCVCRVSTANTLSRLVWLMN